MSFMRTDCIGGPIPVGHKPATDKQVKYARSIGRELNLSLPLANSSEIYRKWISIHAEEFNKKRKEEKEYADSMIDEDSYYCSWPIDDDNGNW